MSDISLEPLFNKGDASGYGARVTPVSEVGAASHRSAIALSTIQQITIGTGKRTIELHNTGNSTIYYGGSGVDDTNGGRIFAGDPPRVFSNVKDDFSIYVMCKTGESTTLRIVEYA